MSSQEKSVYFKEEGFPAVELFSEHFEIEDLKRKMKKSYRYDEVSRIRYHTKGSESIWFLNAPIQDWFTLFRPKQIVVTTKNQLEWDFQTLTLTNERLTLVLREIGRRCREVNEKESTS